MNIKTVLLSLISIYMFYWLITISKRPSHVSDLQTTTTTTEQTTQEAEEATLKIKDIFGCSDLKLSPRIVQHGEFYVLSNFIVADTQFKCDESITFASPADYRFLDNLVPLVERWLGPVSISLYAPGDDFNLTVTAINYLRSCSSPLVREYVTFHLFFEGVHTPSVISGLVKEVPCDENLDFYINPPNETYKSKHKLVFPINVGRNIARQESQTHLVFVSDVELNPPLNFVDDFLDFVLRKPYFFNQEPRVFVLPVFEVYSSRAVPNSKDELREMLSNKSAQIFHRRLCMACHAVPQYKKWLADNQTELDVVIAGKREGRNKDWEPFYVGTKSDPLFDERFSWEGQSNKMVQGFVMCLLDYDYLILNNAFLVHKPGIKKAKTQIQKFSKVISKTRKMMRQSIIPEYQKLYGTKKGCHLI